MSYFGLLARWRAVAIFVYNVMICGHIMLRIITKYIAYYHIAELSTRASTINKYMGLERGVKCFIKNAKITVMWLTA